MNTKTMICGFALVLGSGGAIAAVDVFDVHDPETGYFVEVESTDRQDVIGRWCVPSEDACGESYQSEYPLEGVRVSSLFPGILNSNEE